jgi:uncharacterized protein (DUF302 family)
MVQDKISAMDDLFKLIENLSFDEKVQVVERLVGRNSGLSVMLATQHGNNLQSEISLMPNEQVGDVLHAIATKIRNIRPPAKVRGKYVK